MDASAGKTQPTEIAHHMLVSEEEHDGHWIIQLVHALEIRNFIQVADVDNRKILDSVGNTVENLVLSHALGVGVTTKADYNKAVLLAENGLVDVPASVEVRKNHGTHVV